MIEEESCELLYTLRCLGMRLLELEVNKRHVTLRELHEKKCCYHLSSSHDMAKDKYEDYIKRCEVSLFI